MYTNTLTSNLSLSLTVYKRIPTAAITVTPQTLTSQLHTYTIITYSSTHSTLTLTRKTQVSLEFLSLLQKHLGNAGGGVVVVAGLPDDELPDADVSVHSDTLDDPVMAHTHFLVLV